MDYNNGSQSVASLDISTPICSRRSSLHISRKTSWGTPIPPPSSRKESTSKYQGELFDTVDLNANCGGSTISMNGMAWDTLDNIAALGLSFKTDESAVGSTPTPKRDSFFLEDLQTEDDQHHTLDSRLPFNKWVKSIQRRATQRRKTISCELGGPGWEGQPFAFPARERRSRHKKSFSGSSSAFVTAVKSASISIASFSVAPRSRKTGTLSYHQRNDRSSKASNMGRRSEDSSYIARGIIVDQAVTNRLLQRRRVLEEIITTEESYVADVKFLMNVYAHCTFPGLGSLLKCHQVYVTLMASIPTLSLSLKASITRNLNEIVELHDELLGNLHHAIPYSEYSQVYCVDETSHRPPYNHHRWRSLDSVPEHGGYSWLQGIPGMTAEPQEAASVARVFGQKVNTFCSRMSTF